MSTEREMRFAELLTEAVHTIRRRQGKPIAVIQDELTYALGRDSGNPVEYWRKGNIPASQSDLLTLSRELVKRGGLNQEWMEQFWGCTDFLGLAELVGELFSESEQTTLLPQRPFFDLIGRASQVDEILTRLQSERSSPFVAVDGMGGIGKTALIYQVVTESLEDRLFDRAIWIADEHDDRFLASDAGLTYESVLQTLARRLGNRELVHLPLAQREARIASLLKLQKTLIVIDNMETAAEAQHEIAERFRKIIGPGDRVLLASRQRFVNDVYHVHLLGLSDEDSARLMRQEAHTRGLSRVERTPPADLFKIAQKTGGSPLALKLAVGQLGYQPLDVVVTRFQQVQLLDAGEMDEYARLYRHIFMPSWELLSTEARRLLISMTHFAAGFGGTFESIKVTSGLDTGLLATRIDELWQLAFLETGDATHDQIRYYLHALTRHFVLSDIVRARHSVGA